MLIDETLESVEALSWLKQSDGKERAIREDGSNCLEAAKALQLVQELYSAGATEVLAQGLCFEDEFEDAGSLKVMLPKDPKARAALFAIEARALRDMDTPFDPEGENGQSFFILGW